MKTTACIKAEMKSLRKHLERGKALSAAEVQQGKNRLVFLRQCLAYLESKPRVEFVHAELEKLRKRQESITTLVSGLNRTNRRELLQLHNFSKIEYQINTLNFLIS